MLQAPLQKDLRWNILKYCMHCTWLKTLNMLTVNVQPNLVGPGLGMRKVDQILLQLTNPESWHAEIILHMFHVWNQETHGYPRDTGSSPWIIGWTWEDQTISSWQSEWEGHPCFYVFMFEFHMICFFCTFPCCMFTSTHVLWYENPTMWHASHTHTPVCRTFWFAVRNSSGCRKRQREMGLRMSMWARVHAVLMIGAPGRLKVKRLPRM